MLSYLPDVLLARRVTCSGRNFPGHELITAILDAGGHVIARVKERISLPLEPGGWLPDRSRLTWLNASSGKKEDRLPVRAAEHNVTFGEDKSTITGAGNRTSGPVLRSGFPRLVISEAWAWLTGTQLVRPSAAALGSQQAAARALRRQDAARSPRTRNPSPPPGTTRSARHQPRSRPRHRSPPPRTSPPARPCTP